MKLLRKIFKRFRKSPGPESSPPLSESDLPEIIPTLVIAGNYTQFFNYLGKNRLNGTNFHYIRDADDIRGYRKVNVLRVGEYWKNPLDTSPELKCLEIVSEEYGNNVIPRSELNLEWGLPRPLGYTSSPLGQSQLYRSAFEVQRKIAEANEAMLSQLFGNKPSILQGLTGSGLDGSYREPEQPKPDIPMQQPTGKRRIKLRD